MASTEDAQEKPQPNQPRRATTRPERRRGMTRGAIRAERRARSEGRKRRRRVILYALAGIAGAAFIASLLVPGGLRASQAFQTAKSRINTGGPVTILPDEGRTIIGTEQTWDKYRTRPATSGPYWSTAPTSAVPDGAPARWGEYDHALPDEVLVHNLEVGGIGLHYDCPDGCSELVDQLRGAMGESASFFILAPYPGMDHRIAITSWRHLLYLDDFDGARISEFVGAYMDRAIESQPGNQF